MTNAKAVNYTAEQTAKVVTDYKAGVTVEAIAESVGKTTRSIVAKLSRELGDGYKGKTTAKAEKVVNVGKADLSAKVAKVAGLTADEAKDLQKLTKQTLVNLLVAVSRVAVE